MFTGGESVVTGLNQFLQVCGHVTVTQIVTWAMAIIFLFLIYKEIRKFVTVKVKEHQQKLDEEKARNEKLEAAYAVTQKYPAYHQESIQIRDTLQQEIDEIRNRFGIIMDRLDEIEKQNKKRECSKLRDMLLQNYRYYTNKNQNPSQSWTQMESEAFWELFKEYEEAGGNGYMHTEVLPAMQRLEIVEVGKH